MSFSGLQFSKKVADVELKIENNTGLVLWLGPNDLIQVPMNQSERVQCRKALLDALDLLDQTIVKFDTFSTGAEKDGCWRRNPQHLSDCLGVYDSSLPSEQREGNLEPQLRLVSADPPLKGC